MRNNVLRASNDFFQFFRNSSFGLKTTDSEKIEAFLQLNASIAPTLVSYSKKCKRYHESHKC